MKLNMKLIQDFDRVIIENFEPFQYMFMHYNGSFEGNMVANGNVLIRRNILYFYNIKPDETNVLFTYNGNFNIKKTFIYNKNKRNYILTKKETDDVGGIKSKWNESTSKYTHFSRTNKYKPYMQTILTKRK
tara:strand:- start:96 stop:488 length:393 start_codon:yes stop_codon:yes gene_type:complete